MQAPSFDHRNVQEQYKKLQVIYAETDERELINVKELDLSNEYNKQMPILALFSNLQHLDLSCN